MANLSYPQRRKIQTYLIAAMLAILCLILVACNSDNSYSVAGETVSEPTHFMAKFMIVINNALGGGAASFGWTVVLFTVILRLILSPFDIWQKLIARKNSKAMERMKPQLEVIQSRYADDKQRLQQEQMALYKKEKYSTMGMCLPTIITFVVFFVVFAGFRQMVGYQFAKDYKECVNTYNQTIAEQIEQNKDAAFIVDNGDGKFDIDDVAKTEEGAAFYKQAKEKAQQAVYDVYYSSDQVKIRSWLWIKNIFVSDNWAEAVPDLPPSRDKRVWRRQSSPASPLTNTTTSWASCSARADTARTASGTDFSSFRCCPLLCPFFQPNFLAMPTDSRLPPQRRAKAKRLTKPKHNNNP